MNSWNPYNTLNLQKLETSELFQGAHKKLRENRWYKPLLDFAEETTKINRVYLVSGIGSLLALTLLFEYEELEKAESGLGRKWLMYWFLHAALNFCEIFFFFLYWIPGYWIIKKNHEVIDNAINQVVRTAHTIYTDSDGHTDSDAHLHQN
ncbi:receptor expression-enhancing protein [Trichonephila inaurata madagascariensis]|uniref:Receptor expression-enhancing protein n=1 Tax=Trichonephila inaurata madagascariensis TaxID=2747483 RepID=A0A8X7CRQ6_9ARAC|nr:receptor expression-enhancing protein [Trichonephila inaurata madagascariensis]